jgi:hypothetical protein
MQAGAAAGTERPEPIRLPMEALAAQAAAAREAEARRERQERPIPEAEAAEKVESTRD